MNEAKAYFIMSDGAAYKQIFVSRDGETPRPVTAEAAWRLATVSERELLDIIRRGLISCGVDHDDAEWLADRVLRELQSAGLIRGGEPVE